jgi:hypothetical protein
MLSLFRCYCLINFLIKRWSANHKEKKSDAITKSTDFIDNDKTKILIIQNKSIANIACLMRRYWYKTFMLMI